MEEENRRKGQSGWTRGGMDETERVGEKRKEEDVSMSEGCRGITGGSLRLDH